MKKFLHSIIIFAFFCGCAHKKTVKPIDCNYIMENIKSRCDEFQSVYAKGSGVISNWKQNQGFQFVVYGKSPDSVAIEIIGPFGISVASALLLSESIWVQMGDSFWSGTLHEKDSVFVIPIPAKTLVYLLAKLPPKSVFAHNPIRCMNDKNGFSAVFNTDEAFISLNFSNNSELNEFLWVPVDNPDEQIRCVFEDDNHKMTISAPKLGTELQLKFSERKINRIFPDNPFTLPRGR